LGSLAFPGPPQNVPVAVFGLSSHFLPFCPDIFFFFFSFACARPKRLLFVLGGWFPFVLGGHFVCPPYFRWRLFSLLAFIQTSPVLILFSSDFFTLVRAPRLWARRLFVFFFSWGTSYIPTPRPPVLTPVRFSCAPPHLDMNRFSAKLVFSWMSLSSPVESFPT